MLEQIFGSKTRVKILSLFLANPKQAFYVREITRKIKEQINSVRRELLNLKRVGVLKEQKKGNKNYFVLNTKFEFLNEFKKIFSKAGQRFSLESKFSKDLVKLGDIHYAALMGNFVQNPFSKIDFFLVGKVDKKKLKSFVKILSKEVSKEINYTFLTLEDFQYRKSLYDRFLTDIMAEPKIVLINRLS